MRPRLAIVAAALTLSACHAGAPATPTGGASATSRGGTPIDEAGGGYPSGDSAARARDEGDLARAVEAYRFFYPTVSGEALFDGNDAVGLVANHTFGVLDAKPRHVVLTANSDTPYGAMPLDLGDGPMIVEVPAGPLVIAAVDIHQRWVADMGIPGPDEGRGGKYVIVPPGHTGRIPSNLRRADASANRVLVAVRALPVNGDVRGAFERIQTVRVRPLRPPVGWEEPTWIDLTDRPQQSTPVPYETTFEYWQVLAEVIDREPVYAPYRVAYGQLASLGIVKGQPFAPDTRMRRILEEAARRGHAAMRSASFADPRPDRVVWSDRTWEWASLVPDGGDFEADSFVDLHAREKWFYQAILASPAMFRRRAGGGSVYWLAARDGRGAFLDGARTYRLVVPQPVPAKLFWSVTVYDAETRSQIATEQGKAALRSLFELRDADASSPVTLTFGPTEPAQGAERWIRTIPGRGWFAYFRVYGPEGAALDGTWKPGNFDAVE